MEETTNAAKPVVGGYDILEKVDVGGTSVVWRAVEAALGRVVALADLILTELISVIYLATCLVIFLVDHVVVAVVPATVQ